MGDPGAIRGKEENFAAQIGFYKLGLKNHRYKWSYGASISSWVVVSNMFFILTPTWGDDPIWLILFKWGETTN